VGPNAPGEEQALVARVVVIGVALAVGAGIVALAWAVADDDRPGQVVTHDVGRPVSSAPADSGPDTTSPVSPPTSEAPPSALEGPPLQVSDLEVLPGAVIHVSGGGCGVDGPPTVGDWEVRVWLAPAAGTVPWDPAFGDPVATLAPDASGGWQVDLLVPQWTTEYRLEAACFDQATPPAGFLYRHERVLALDTVRG
jgi:hypothetical protein